MPFFYTLTHIFGYLICIYIYVKQYLNSYPVPKECPQIKTGAVPLTLAITHSIIYLLSLTIPVSESSALSLSP